MPRLTFKDYLEHRAFLKLAWEEFDQLYSLLPVDQQWQLHDYYQPLHSYTEDELREHRAHITKTNPSRPAQAGRHYAKLHRVYETALRMAQQDHRAERRARTPAAPGSRRVTVRAVARPEPDLHKLSLALIALAREMARGENRRG